MAWVGLLGGLGLFLLGMAFLTESLQAALGGKVKAIMQRMTRNRMAAFGTGAAVTAVIQSSSATSLITIGLVGAGLITLAQAIAVLIGANVGTTATAYLVSLIGLKFSVSAVALPLVGIGGLARVFVHGRQRIVADLLLGFGLLFVGIDFMQGAMADVASGFDLTRFAGTGILSSLLLVLAGIIITAMMQSSSAAMAATLAALAGGAIDLRMGAYLVVGQNIGTTITAVIGAIGGSIDARRTAAAHGAFNVGTGLVAILLLPWLLLGAQRIAHGDGAVALAVFHTLFNVLGAVIFLPLAGILARYLQRVLRSKGDALTGHLDPTVLRVSAASKEAIRRTLGAIMGHEVHLVQARLAPRGPGRGYEKRVHDLHRALDATQDFIADARSAGLHGDAVAAGIQCLDHLRNIAADLGERPPLGRFQGDAHLGAYLVRFQAIAGRFPAVVDGREHTGPLIEELAGMTKHRKRLRTDVLEGLGKTADADVHSAQADLEAVHWLDRIAWHLRQALLPWAAMDGEQPSA